jgi:hypothetical protein
MTKIADSLNRIRDEIESAAATGARKPEDIKLVAVSKTKPVDLIMEAYNAGQRVFGENRVQELIDKVEKLPNDIEWHLIGHLQTNKSKNAVKYSNIIESIDSIHLFESVEKAASVLNKKIDVLVQVDIGQEDTKFGVEEENLFELIKPVINSKYTILKGLMCIPPFLPDPEDIRPYFIKMRELLDIINTRFSLTLSELSMGMTNDYKVAIEEGATIVRIGTAIFGERNY